FRRALTRPPYPLPPVSLPSAARLCALALVLLLAAGAAPSPALSAGCPARCVCDEQLVVQCAGQRLAEFPAELPLATRQLILSDNGIGELPALQLNYLADLVYLDCSNNSLSELSESTFGNLRKLAYLDLSFNALARIDARTFGPLASLVMLRMTDNPGLSEIDARAFAENAALQVLDVSRNNLTVLNASALMALPALRALGLSGNPWSCDCQTEDLLRTRIERYTLTSHDHICQAPAEMRGRRLSEVGMQLRSECHQGLGYWDYLFFIAIGFVIFSAGTTVMTTTPDMKHREQRGHNNQQWEEIATNVQRMLGFEVDDEVDLSVYMCVKGERV
uniref:LRRNT domain-containing protein n=1 Tax=Astyanax mexicanus TaxID=7994 RepID=A0A8B9RDC8_ASTMX